MRSAPRYLIIRCVDDAGMALTEVVRTRRCSSNDTHVEELRFKLMIAGRTAVFTNHEGIAPVRGAAHETCTVPGARARGGLTPRCP